MTTLCTNFKQNRPTFISKSAPVSQEEALKEAKNLARYDNSYHTNYGNYGYVFLTSGPCS